MNEETQAAILPDEAVQTACCDLCGRPGASRFADRWICDTCYCESGSCCPEFGREAEEP